MGRSRPRAAREPAAAEVRMTTKSKLRARLWGTALVLGLAALAPSAMAQRSGEGFLFQPPLASFNLRGGFAHASAGSDIFSFSTEQFTLGKGDFSSPTVEAELQFT